MHRNNLLSQFKDRCRRVPCRVRRGLLRDDGIAGIETALLIPLVMVAFLGFAEIYFYIRAAGAVERVAFTLADTLGQKSSIKDINTTTSADNIGAYWNAAQLVGQPLDMDHLGKVIITSVCDTNSNNCVNSTAIGTAGKSGTPNLLWQRLSPDDGPLNPKAKSLLGKGLTPSGWPFHSGDAMLAVEAFYVFNPFTMTSNFWPDAPGSQVIYAVAFARPRWNKPIQLTAS